MSKLTISVDAELIKKARLRAIQQGTSLSAKVCEFLQQFVNAADANVQNQREATALRILSAIDHATAQSQSAQASAPVVGGSESTKPSLRDAFYDGDFRARDRVNLA